MGTDMHHTSMDTEMDIETRNVLTEALQEVLDPELGVNIYDLGLIYDMTEVDGHVTITMTLTTPGCPLHDSITNGVKYAIGSIGGVEKVTVQVVWEPAWEPAMMSAEAKKQLGW